MTILFDQHIDGDIFLIFVTPKLIGVGALFYVRVGKKISVFSPLCGGAKYGWSKHGRSNPNKGFESYPPAGADATAALPDAVPCGSYGSPMVVLLRLKG